MTIKLANSNALRYLSIAVFLFIGIYLTSCEKEIKLNLSSGDAQVVIEGQIENDLPPVILLTKSMGFFSKIDLNTLEENFIHGAFVTVTDGTILDTLREYSLDTGGGAKFFFYSVDTSSLNNTIIGAFNKSYTLSVTYEGKTYEATTTIPSVIAPQKFYADTILPARFRYTPADAVQLYIDVEDPDTSGNYIRYWTRRNDNESFYPVDVVSAEEIGRNGDILEGVRIGFGYPRNVADSLPEAYPHWGDSITLKWCAIDKNVYKFWQTYQFAINVVGNPFASPTNLPSNISNGGLGIWAGYGSSTVKIQEYIDRSP